jgi:hypothetical protein
MPTPNIGAAGADSGPNASQQQGQALPTEAPLPPTGPTTAAAGQQTPPQATPTNQQPQAPQAPPTSAQPPGLDLSRGQAPAHPWREQLLIWAMHPNANDSLKRLAQLANLKRNENG